MTVITDSSETSATEQKDKARQPLTLAVAIALSAVAILLSGISLAGWAQASAERDQIQSRLSCLELPGPNDCGQDGR